MGNHNSTNGDHDALASPSSPAARASEASLRHSSSFAQPQTSYYYLPPQKDEDEVSIAVYNPFDRATNRENYPPLSQVLHYNPAGGPEPGPSVETLAALYPVNFPLVFPNPGLSSADELADDFHAAWREKWFKDETSRKLRLVRISTDSPHCWSCVRWTPGCCLRILLPWSCSVGTALLLLRAGRLANTQHRLHHGRPAVQGSSAQRP